MGYIYGYSKGVARALPAGIRAAIAALPTLTTQQKEDVARNGKKEADFLLPSARWTVGDGVAAMDAFYSDYRNIGVCWDDAISFSSDSLGGHTPTDEGLAAAREKAAKKGCQ